MVFLDGVGIGKRDFEFNPFFKYGFKTFEKIFGTIPSLENPVIEKENLFLFPADATLGVRGLPQSGTGQVALFCGFNAPKFAGKHFGPFPFSTTVPILLKENILLHYKKNGESFFANAYPKIFFDYINSGKSRLSTTALTYNRAGIKFNNVSDVRNGKALTAELTNERWNKKLGYKLPIIKPKTAARRLLRIASKNKFTLFEYYLTDHLGHWRLADEFDKLYSELDQFLFTLLDEMDKNNITLVICSDHGNLEDLSVKTHTLNPSLTITAGKYSEAIFRSVKSITDIKLAITKYCK
ncbi:MAG: metalloenzyme [Ignavibacteriae bacterium]|nr:MAG: metalloenzyme [Ignavibacteriota bacterium]